jgi:crossover junction endodeoxyribonuclease RuvC
VTALVVGIDPGLTGAIAAVCPTTEQLLWVEDLPAAGGEIAVPLLHRFYGAELFGPWEMDAHTPIAIERVGAMPKQGVTSTFRFGVTYGLLRGYFAGRGNRITLVGPAEWKRTHRLIGTDKDAARALAINLWPNEATFFARKKDVDRADAALIALHHARTINQQRGAAA